MWIRRFFIWCVFSLISGLGTCKHCPSSDNESVLEKNKAYTYRFRSEALSQAVGTTDDHGKIILECDVHVNYDRPCNYFLNLQHCVVTATGGQPGSQTAWIDRQPLPDLSKYPIAFSLIKGEINEVKTHDEDPLYYVNIKRGVLSAFVFKLSQTEKEIKESHTDIHGVCPMTSKPAETLAAVKTSKDMLHCQFPSRPDWQFSPWSLFWNMSFIQHVINSTTDCIYKVNKDERKLEEVTCKERHAIMLESTHKTTTAVQTNVNYHLVFMASEVQTSKPAFPILTRETGIQYEYEETPVPLSSPLNFLPVAEKMLADLVLDSADEIRLFTIPQFTDFVAWLRSSHDLRPFVDRVRSCSFLPEGVPCDQKIKDLTYSYLSDALLQCNTLPCIKAVTYIAEKGDLSPEYLHAVYISWSYMHYSKPGFIANFVDICRMKKSQQCWMSLGNYVQRIYQSNNNLDEKVLKEAKEVTNYFYSHIGEDCDINEDTSKSLTDCLVYMKAASNMGRYYVTLQPEGLYQLLEVITNENSTVVVRTSALEALKDIFVPEDRDARMEIYDQLLPLFKNETLASSIRIFAYDQLLVASEDHYFEEHVLSVLKDGRNAEVKNYVADSLNTLMADRKFRKKRQKFLSTIVELLREHGLSLERMLFENKGQSKSSSSNIFLNFPFLPDFMKRFGLKIRDSFIYDSQVYPSVFNHKAIFQLFNTILPATRLGSYFEGFEELLLAYQKNLQVMDSKATPFPQILDSIMKTVEEFGNNILEKGSLHNFDESVLLNVKKLHELYWKHHEKLNPYAKAYFDLFGSTVKHFVFDSMPSSSMKTGLQNMMRGFAMGNSQNVTRVIRVIEAYHQVPTMMGLPLNWTTNATLAFSIRAGLKMRAMNPDVFHMQITGFLQPSVALTFLNRMVLDFPTVTQIGVQANSSAYTSTAFRALYDVSSGEQKLRIYRPSRTQKVLELFRTNQLIKHNRYEDIPDWDIERVSSSWCTTNDINSAGGLKFCLEKSYPDVTHRIKPWALMAGWCKWQFLIHHTNEAPVHYDFLLQVGMKHKLKEYNAKFSVTEKETEKDPAALFKAAIDENGTIQKMELKTSLIPDFSASMTRKELTTGKKVSGHKIEADLVIFGGFKYEIEASNERKVQKTSSESSPIPDEDSQMLVNENKLSLTTPFSSYKWEKSVLKLGEDVKADAFLSYESLKPNSNWMKNILPPSFWDNDMKASLKVRLHWKKPISNSQGSVTTQKEFRFQIPGYTMTLTADDVESRFGQQMYVNFARMDVNRGKLDAFLNCTFDWLIDVNAEQDKDIAVVNITIPRRSWAIMYQKVREGMKFQHEVKLRRASMKPKNAVNSDYVGWWSKEVSDRFRVEEKEIKLSAKNEWTTSEEITRKYSTVKSADLQGLGSAFILNNFVIQYPVNDKTESFIYDGFLIFSSGSETFRFQKDFDLTSSYNNLKLTSHSVYLEGSGESYLDHSSYFTHLGTQTKAYNTIYYTYKKPGKCTHRTFKHDIRSHVFDLSTNAVYKCEKEEDELYTLRLTLNTNSSKWNMLDIKLDQIVEDVSSEYSREEMTTTHAAGTLHVDAEWHKNPKPNHHQKRVVLCSKNGHCPNAELLIENLYDGRATVKFILPNRNDTQITYERNRSPDYKNLDIKVGYSNQQDGMSSVLDFTGEILAPRFHVWKGTLNTTSYAIVENLIASGYETARSAFANIASDQSHPLNQMLQPALKMPLYEYWNGLKMEFKEILAACWSDVSEIFGTIEACAEPAYLVMLNVINSVDDTFWSTYNALKEKSVTIWAIDYFNLPYYVYQGFTNLPRAAQVLLNQITSGDDSILNFNYITGRLLVLSSFREWPYFDFDFSDLKKFILREVEDVMKFNNWAAGHKVAMIFGPSHVYTFDGHLYDVPQYPHKDCLFLLAHDIHRSLFTVLSSEKGIHILFPEMSVTINERNEVFINGSRQPSSLPVQSDNGKVTVRRGHVVEVWSPTLSILCRGLDFLCTLRLGAYHSGGVIGLLGNADRHAANDYALPSGNTSSSFLDFVKMYEVSGKSECQNLAVPVKTDPTVPEQMICLRKFEDVCISHFHMREKFLDACFADVKAGHDACYAASGLSALCHLKYMPSYTSCNAMKQEKQTIGRSLEVVFVVQENKYLSSPDKPNSPVKGIESLVKALDSKFKESGYGSVKYSLVGFGGSGVHYAPSVHSFEKDMWLSADLMIKDGLKTLEFKGKEYVDGISGLKYALEELGHDSFDSKVFIVITVKDRQVTDKPLTNYIRQLLENNGITLYTMSSYPSIEKGKKVFGVRADGLIFPSQGQDGEAYLDFPRGDLAKLSASTRGSVFLSKFLRENKPQAFFTEFAQEVWAKINKETQKCRFCLTVRGRWWWYKNECKIVHC